VSSAEYEFALQADLASRRLQPYPPSAAPAAVDKTIGEDGGGETLPHHRPLPLPLACTEMPPPPPPPPLTTSPRKAATLAYRSSLGPAASATAAKTSPDGGASTTCTLPDTDKTGQAAKASEGLATVVDYGKEEERTEEFVSIQEFVAQYDFSTEGLERVVLDLEEAGRMAQVYTYRTGLVHSRVDTKVDFLISHKYESNYEIKIYFAKFL
jgi:hypothetical protein